MLQAPSHLSRVCGHGHIKKFWLMQIQKDIQSCESRNNLLFSSPTSCPANRGSVKESSSPSPRSWKAGSTPSPLGLSGAETDTEELSNGHLDRLDSFSMSAGGDADIFIPFPYALSFNAAAQETSHGSSALVRGGCTESISKSHLSLGTESVPLSHSAQISRAVQGLTDLRPLEAARNETSEPEDLTSSANASRDHKSFSSHVRSATPTSPDDAAQQAKNGLLIESSMQEIDHDSLSQASYMQFPVLKACSLCGTTKTPMWRSGPQGPKSLCNACGIRFKKYRSFPGQEPSEVMASHLQGAVVPKVLPRPLKRKQNLSFPVCESPRSQKTSLKVAVSDLATGQQEKKSKWHQLVAEREPIELKNLNYGRSNSWFTQAGPPSLKKIYGCSPFQSKFKKLGPMDDHLNVNSVFAKDEEEAAVLLMHLSCGLVY